MFCNDDLYAEKKTEKKDYMYMYKWIILLYAWN